MTPRVMMMSSSFSTAAITSESGIRSVRRSSFEWCGARIALP